MAKGHVLLVHWVSTVNLAKPVSTSPQKYSCAHQSEGLCLSYDSAIRILI